MTAARRIRPHRLLALLLFVLPLLAACGVAVAKPAQTPQPDSPTPKAGVATSTVAAPVGTATPDTALLLKDGGIAMIQSAFDRLMDEYIQPEPSSRLLDGAWTLLGQEADTESLALPAKPAFDDDRASDFALFRGAYVQLTSGVTDATKLRYAAIGGMTAALQDCHTYFLNPVASDTLSIRAPARAL